MSKIGHNFPPGDEDLPIPLDVQPDLSWTEQMLEMSAHIGPYATLRLVEAFGGARIYVPADPEKGKVYPGRGSIREVIGMAAARKLSAIYRREYLVIPNARYALNKAKRRDVIASVRAGDITATEAARRLDTTRTYMSHLVNHTDEAAGEGEAPIASGVSIPGQMHLFDDDED